MITTDLLDEVKAKKCVDSDYKLAQVLDFSKQKVSDLRSGKEKPGPYECAKIAEALDRDPLAIIAQVEAEGARTEKKREYWRSFFSGLKQAPHVVALCGILGFSAAGWPVGAEASNTSHNVYYVKLNKPSILIVVTIIECLILPPRHVVVDGRVPDDQPENPPGWFVCPSVWCH